MEDYGATVQGATIQRYERTSPPADPRANLPSVVRHSVRCGSVSRCVPVVGGIRVWLHWSLLILMLYDIIVLWAMDWSKLPPYLGLPAWAWGAIFVMMRTVILFLTVFVHELGHAWAARTCGGSAEDIVLWPLGGLAIIDADRASPGQHLWISFAGPATHIPQLLVWLVPLVALGASEAILGRGDYYLVTGGIGVLLCAFGVQANLILFCFNMLPAYPLDGGHILASGLLLCGLNPNAAARVTCLVAAPITIAIAVGMAVYYGFQLGAVLISVVLCLWLLHGCLDLWKLQAAGEAWRHPLFNSARTPSAAAAAAVPAPNSELSTTSHHDVDVLVPEGVVRSDQRV